MQFGYIAEYDPNNPQPSHFTQVVWKGTTQVGCAVQDCSNIFQGSGVRLNILLICFLWDDDGNPVCRSHTFTFVNTHPQEMLLGSSRVFLFVLFLLENCADSANSQNVQA